MDKSHITRLADKLNSAIWKNPGHSIKKLLRANKGQDPRELAHAILRNGTAFSKDEKKYYGIHASAKVFDGVCDHLEIEGLKDCVKEVTGLAYDISSIEAALSQITDWRKWGIAKVKFSPAPDACPICKELEGVYELKNIPVPVLDTHSGCRCCLVPTQERGNEDSGRREM